MQKKCKTTLFSFLLLTLFVFSCLIPQHVAAANASKSANSDTDPASSSSAEETTMELKRRIEKVVEEKREQIKGAISSLLADKHGFTGEVSRLSQEAITLKQNGDSRIIPIDEDLTILQKGKKIKADRIEVGNWVTVIGSGSTDKFNPEYILVSAENLRPKDRVVTIGSLTEVGRSTIKIIPRGSGEVREFSIIKTSKLENVDGTAIKLTDFDEDLSVLVIGTKNAQDTWEIVRIRSITDVKSSN